MEYKLHKEIKFKSNNILGDNMGYAIYLKKADFRIDKSRHEEARLKLIEFMRTSYVSHNYNLSGDPSLEELMSQCRWEVKTDADGHINDISFVGENHWDSDDVFKTLAPFVDDGCYLQLYDDEGDQWVWSFEKSKLLRKQSVI